MAQTTLSIRMDEDIKRQFDKLCSDFGMNTSVAINVFAKAVIQARKIPFEIKADIDPFYSECNMRYLMESIEQGKRGEVVIKTMEELEAMANE